MMTTAPNRARLAVSTWSLHRSLGKPPFTGPDSAGPQTATPTIGPAFSLLELPAKIAAEGIRTLEICHFHIPSRDPAYLKQLRSAIEAAGVALWELLIDAGDVTDPHHAERDIAWIEGWIDVAGQLGATRARVIAGKAKPSPTALRQSQQALQRLAAYAQTRNVRVMTENFHDLTSTPEALLTLLDGLDGQVGLLADFGNWKGPNKYADLAQIFPRAESYHAKCHFNGPTEMDREDYVRCLELAQAAGTVGPYSLIYDGPGNDEFAGLRWEREVVSRYL